MFSPTHLQTPPDRTVLRALNGMRQIHPAIPPVRPAAAQPSASGRILWTRLARNIAPEVQP